MPAPAFDSLRYDKFNELIHFVYLPILPAPSFVAGPVDSVIETGGRMLPKSLGVSVAKAESQHSISFIP